MDKESKRNLYRIVEKENYDLVIAVTHQLDDSRVLFDKIIQMEEGQVKKELTIANKK